MKNTYILTLLFLLTVCTAQAQDGKELPAEAFTLQQAEKYDSLATKLFKSERYHDAINLKKKSLIIRDSLQGKKDTMYINGLVFLGKLYFRDKQANLAVDALKEATKLYADNISDKDENYAFYLDNLSLYQSVCKDYTAAEANSRKALSIYEAFGRHDNDLAIILFHLAENCYYNGNTAEAIKHEIRALNIFKSLYGEHSSEYVNELSYLAMYYEEAGKESDAKRVRKKREKLQEEIDEGYEDLAEPIEFDSAESCHEHNEDALKCCLYYINHELTAPNSKQAVEYIMKWATASEDFSVEVDDAMAQLVESAEAMPYFVAFTAISAILCLGNELPQLDEDKYVEAIQYLLQFYDNNMEITGKVKVLDDYSKLQAENKLEKRLRKEYQKFQKQLKNNQEQ